MEVTWWSFANSSSINGFIRMRWLLVPKLCTKRTWCAFARDRNTLAKITTHLIIFDASLTRSFSSYNCYCEVLSPFFDWSACTDVCTQQLLVLNSRHSYSSWNQLELILIRVLTRTQNIDSTYWYISKFTKPFLRIAGPKNIQHKDYPSSVQERILKMGKLLMQQKWTNYFDTIKKKYQHQRSTPEICTMSTLQVKKQYETVFCSHPSFP